MRTMSGRSVPVVIPTIPPTAYPSTAGPVTAEPSPTLTRMDFENKYLKDRSLEDLIDALGGTAEPGSRTHEMMKAAIQAKMVERLAAPKRWATVAAIAAVTSAGGAVASAVAAFS